MKLTLDHAAAKAGLPVFLDDRGGLLGTARAIKMMRHDRALSVDKFGALLGVSGRTVNGWEQGRPISPRFLYAIDRLLKPILRPSASPRKGAKAEGRL
jgi:transcriptional regulator with XRE-family HTH domain